MTTLPLETIHIIKLLQARGVEPILYGSQGVSLYVGAFKKFGDVDLLVEDSWLNADWQRLVKVMEQLGFTLVNEHEHEFANGEDKIVAFASATILIRDKITSSIQDAVGAVNVDGVSVRTLKPRAFLKAYQFSARDGYRKDVRHKKDNQVIELVEDYLARLSYTHEPED